MSSRSSIIPVFVPHLGCPHACVFCNQRRITGQTRPATADTVRAAVLSAEKVMHSGKRELAFYGGSFTAIEEKRQIELLSAAKEAMEAGKIDAIRLSTRPDAIDESVLARLQRFGVETVELGAQSMDDAVLAASKRGHTARDVQRASAMIKAGGFRLILQMMTGLPGDTSEKSLKTAEKIISCAPDGVRIYPAVVVKNTELYELWQSGAYREHTVEDAVEVCARIVPLFDAAGIPVIRLGLNPTEELTNVAAVAGAYHPALGELVKSRIFFHRAAALLSGIAPGSRVVLEVYPSQLSQMIGQHRENIKRLQKSFSLADVRVRPADIPCGELRVRADENAEKS